MENVMQNKDLPTISEHLGTYLLSVLESYHLLELDDL